jgi:nucleoside-diphosphate-sugar epimerase
MSASSGGQRVVLVAGALGVVGRAALAHFEGRGDSRVIGLSRRAPDFATSSQWLRVDLTDAAATAEAVRAVPDVTHLVYTALFEEPELVSGWTGDRQIRTNLEMLRNLVEPLQQCAPGLRHVTLLQGTKAYGIHHGPFPIPAKESDPRFIAPNFYYDQEDWLRDRAAGADWDITVLRPQLVCGHAVGNPMNAVAALGVYACITRELGLPLRFPGGEPCIQQAVDAELLARAIAWAGEEPRCRGEIYNITNGDEFTWPNLWGAFADAFDMKPGAAHPHALAAVMPGRRAVWDAMVRRHDLRPLGYKEVVRSWEFLDFTLRHGELRPRHSIMSTVKARQHGFAECMDTEAMFRRQFRKLQDRRVLPPNPAAPLAGIGAAA